MSSTSLRWSFAGGYSDLLATAIVELQQKTGPLATDLRISPGKLLKKEKSLEIDFSAKDTFSGQIRSFFTWRISPATYINVKIIGERGAFLGNFRVPKDHYAVQWKILPTACAQATPDLDDLPLTATVDSLLSHTWVEMFPDRIPLNEGIKKAWSNCINPFDPQRVSAITPNQVLRWNWSGLFRITAGIKWSLARGWVLEGNHSGFGYSLPFRTGVSLRNQVRFTTSGHFYLQLSRKNGPLKFSLIKEREHEERASGSLNLRFTHSPGIKTESRLLEPVLDIPEKAIKECLTQKFRMALAFEHAGWIRKKRIFKAVWTEPLREDEFISEYRHLLSGGIPSRRDSFSSEGRYDRIQGQEFTIKINLFNRLAGFKKTSTRFDSLVVTPSGDILLEKGISKTDIRYRWDELEFIRLTLTRVEREKDYFFQWDWRNEGRFERDDLTRLLRSILHGKIIRRFILPGNLSFPLELDISTSTRFSEEGIETVKQATPTLQWETLIRALELIHSQRYAAGSFWRDWIDFQKVRHEIVRNPVHCHLSSCYPLQGRTEIERKLVVADYKRALRFMEIMNLWQEDRDPILLFQKCLDFPLFLYFHLLCPAGMKNSLLTITGDWEDEIGDTLD